jgi:hypothetical protein
VVCLEQVKVVGGEKGEERKVKRGKEGGEDRDEKEKSGV